MHGGRPSRSPAKKMPQPAIASVLRVHQVAVGQKQVPASELCRSPFGENPTAEDVPEKGCQVKIVISFNPSDPHSGGPEFPQPLDEGLEGRKPGEAGTRPESEDVSEEKEVSDLVPLTGEKC